MFRYNFRQYGNKELNTAIDACAKADVGLIAMKTQGSESGIADAWKRDPPLSDVPRRLRR